MNILVTGGAGYIGSHICVELLEQGHQVTIIDNFSNAKPEVLDAIKKITHKEIICYHMDLKDRQGVEAVFNQHEVDAVIHLAGLKAVGESVADPLKYYRENLEMTLVLCDVMKKHHVKNIVFSSSATVYGNNACMPVTEESKLEPTNPYGRTKLIIEQLLEDLYVSDHSWNIIILRYFNPIGAHKSGLIGEDPQGRPNNLVPYIAKVAVGQLEYVNIFGNDYDTPDGTGVRDYIHVVDLAKGHLKALLRLQHCQGVEKYNLGTGKGYSVYEILRTYEKVSQQVIHYEIVNRRAGDSAVCYADVRKAKALLGWEAEKNIYDMCRDSWHFICMQTKELEGNGGKRYAV